MEKTISFIVRCCIVLLAVCICADSHAQNYDIKWLRSINGTRGSSTDGLMNSVSQSAYPVSFIVPATQLLFGYIKKDTQSIHNGWQTVAGLGATVVITYGIKYAVNRPRPYDEYLDIQPYHTDDGPSFPSGHTSLAFATATSLSLQYPKWYVIAPAYLWAGTVGYSRMHLGMHYPSDVAVGALIGAGSAFLSYKGQQWLQKRRNKKTKGIIEQH